MSAENVAVVSAYCDRLSAGDAAGASASLDPHVVWYGTRGGLDENQVLRGPDAVEKYFLEIQGMWERLDLEVEQLIDAGDAVVAFWSEIARTQHTDVDIRTTSPWSSRFSTERSSRDAPTSIVPKPS